MKEVESLFKEEYGIDNNGKVKQATKQCNIYTFSNINGVSKCNRQHNCTDTCNYAVTPRKNEEDAIHVRDGLW